MNILEKKALGLGNKQVGAAMAEYAILLSMVGLLSMGTVSLLGVNVKAIFESVFATTPSSSTNSGGGTFPSGSNTFPNPSTLRNLDTWTDPTGGVWNVSDNGTEVKAVKGGVEYTWSHGSWVLSH